MPFGFKTGWSNPAPRIFPPEKKLVELTVRYYNIILHPIIWSISFAQFIPIFSFLCWLVLFFSWVTVRISWLKVLVNPSSANLYAAQFEFILHDTRLLQLSTAPVAAPWCARRWRDPRAAPRRGRHRWSKAWGASMAPCYQRASECAWCARRWGRRLGACARAYTRGRMTSSSEVGVA